MDIDMSITPEKPTRSKHRYLRFSLRTLLVVQVGASVWLGLLVLRVNRQREAVEWTKQLGGNVHYDYQLDEHGNFVENAEPSGAAWIRELIGIDYFADVHEVAVANSQVSDLAPLTNLTSLKRLFVYRMPIRDVTALAKMTSLERLSLDYTQVHNLRPLSNLTKLKYLSLEHTDVKDVTPLTGLANLERLALDYTKVTELDYRLLQKALPNCVISWSQSDQKP